MPSPVPVLFVIHSLGHGGMERQVAALCLALDRTRYVPHVMTVLDGFRGDDLRRAGVPITVLPVRSVLSPGPLKLTTLISRYIREHAIQLVHVFDPGLGPIAAAAARLCGVTLLSSQRFYMGFVPAKHRWLLQLTHWLSASVVVNSEALKKHLHEDYRHPASRIDLCHNGIDTETFSPHDRARLDILRDADLVIGTVSVLRAEKNLGHLIQAFARVHQERPGVRLLIMGSGPMEGTLKEQCRAAGLKEACVFLPSAPAVPAVMRSIDVFVNCSLSEGLPNALMEAMACGCCGIASDVGGTPELIEPRVHGLLCRAGDLNDLGDKIHWVVRETELRTQLAVAGAKRMREQFSLRSSADTMQSIYDRRIANR